MLASRALLLLDFCRRYGVPALMCSCPGSFVFSLPSFRAFGSRRGAFFKERGSDLLAGADFGFSCMGCWIQSLPPGLVSHPGLEGRLALLFKGSLFTYGAPGEPLPAPGLESVLVNDLLQTSPWEVLSSWKWTSKRHINALESDATLALYKRVALQGGDRRLAMITDSSVVRGAHSKGRSSAKLIRQPLRRASTTIIAGGLYPRVMFGPTRLNPSDDPTREVELRAPAGFQVSAQLSRQELRHLSSLQGLSKPRANWVRLALLLHSAAFGNPTGLVVALRAYPTESRYGAKACVSPRKPRCHMDFDKTLGFPGEGPAPLLRWALPFLLLLSASGTLSPRNADDLRRLDRRLSPLPLGRPVLSGTSSRRVVLVRAFAQWLRETSGCILDQVLEARPFDTERFVDWLILYGQELYGSGRPYWHFSETINALTARKPVLRRACQGAWDLAFTWLSEEPSTHHVALPAILLLAILAPCLAWGWVTEGALFALSWGALLRVSEATAATRRHLVFPEDALFMQTYVLITIDQPKTRGRAAKHQSSKLEQADLVELVSLAFSKYSKSARLWPFSNQTLRRRLDYVLERLGIPKSTERHRSVDLGSFRPGGATFLLQATEDSELVRRRGRWASHKVMEIYLQEVASSTFVADLPPAARSKTLELARLFPSMLDQAKRWRQCNIPSRSWFSLWP